MFALLAALAMVTPGALQAQTAYSGGAFALGMRSTLNIFPADGAVGFGSGGQFKIGVSRRVNTEFFADLIHSSRDNYFYRKDYHIGWSVQFALPRDGFGVKKFTPYVLAGQCFDYTNANVTWPGPNDHAEAFSAAAQTGLGLSHFFGERLEGTLQAQYMIHLTRDIHLEDEGVIEPQIHSEKGADFAGHALFTLSLNYYFLDFKK